MEQGLGLATIDQIMVPSFWNAWDTTSDIHNAVSNIFFHGGNLCACLIRVLDQRSCNSQ